MIASYVKVAPNIIICPNQPQGFNAAVEHAIAEISSCSVGSRLLQKIGKANHVIWITSGQNSVTTFFDALGAVTKGKGSDAEVQMTLKTRLMISPDAREAESPFYIDLAHELIHGYHGLYGKNLSVGNMSCKKLWQDDEEYQTIYGFPSKKERQRTQPKITENAIREEHHLSKIYTHLFASELCEPELVKEIKFQSLAHRTSTAFQQLLENSGFLTNPNKLFFIETEMRAANEPILDRPSEGKNIVIVNPNPHSTPPVLGKIYYLN